MIRHDLVAVKVVPSKDVGGEEWDEDGAGVFRRNRRKILAEFEHRETLRGLGPVSGQEVGGRCSEDPRLGSTHDKGKFLTCPGVRFGDVEKVGELLIKRSRDGDR